MPYSTDAELTAYATARGVLLTGTPATLLLLANDYIESLSYKGTRTDSTQLTAWPRSSVMVDGIYIDYTTVPQGIKNAEMQAAIEIDAGYDPLANIDRAVKREKVDVIEVEYKDNADDSIRLKKISALLRPYLSGGGRVSVVRGI